MKIEESEIDGIYTDRSEELALAWLLEKGVVYLNNIDVGRDKQDYTTIIYASCNDVFAWGMADAECISNTGREDSDILVLYGLLRSGLKYGLEKWVCKKRNMQPQKPLIDMIKSDGEWDSEFDSLPPNPCNLP